MNRLVVAAFFVLTASFLGACGNTGDHLLDFCGTCGGSNGSTGLTPAPNGTPGPAAVSQIVLGLVGASPNPNTAGTYQLNVTIFGANGQAVPVNTLLSSAVVVTSNASCELGFALPSSPANENPSGTFAASVGTNYAPGSGIVMGYTPVTGSVGCTPQNVTVTAGLQSDAVTPGTLSLFGGSATVTGITLMTLATPNPNAAGVYPFFVTLTGTVNGGAPETLPSNLTLANPVTLTDNNACIVGFGNSPNISTGTPQQAITISSSSALTYLYFNPGSASTTCPSTGNVVITASANGAPTVTYSFTNGIIIQSARRKTSQ